MTGVTFWVFPATKGPSMTRDLLWRGMLAGILAALLATLFAWVVAEPQVDRAIALEASHEPRGMDADDQEAPVSRATQKGIGLVTAVLLYGSAAGGVFSLVFTYCYGRIGRIGPRSLALLLAVLGFAAIVLVPAIKYPPNPPAVGQADTIQLRTAAYFGMVAISMVALVVGLRLRSMVKDRIGALDAAIAGTLAYIVLVVAAQAGMPNIDEVPAAFPAALLWNFRLASIGMQFRRWAVLAVAFGRMAETCLQAADRAGRTRQ